MPLYEYECQGCQRHTEKIQKFSDAEITDCPHCGGELQRVITAPAIAFKGGGWYADGYGNAKPKPSGDAATAKAEGSASESEGADKATAATSSSESVGKAGESSAAPASPAPPAAAPTKSSNT